jgi:hypothetical protein
MSTTSLEKICRASRWRITTGPFASKESDGWNGDFMVPLDGDLYHVRISDGLGWRHLSVTNAQRKRTPSWEIMCRLKDYFFADDEWAVQYHPAKEDNINDHPFCLHIWAPLDVELPRPATFLV